MQWNEKAHAGFTSGTPWIAVNANYMQINAQAQINKQSSVFQYYKKLIAYRKENLLIRNGDFVLLFPESDKLFAYSRKLGENTLYVLCNFTDDVVDLPYPLPKPTRVEIGNYPNKASYEQLEPYEAVAYLTK